MKNPSKAWLIIGLILILLGGLLFVGELALHRWDLNAFGTVKLETGSLEIAESFRNISITSDTEDTVRIFLHRPDVVRDHYDRHTFIIKTL